MNEGQQKFKQGCDWKTRKNETTWKTYAYMGQ